MSEDDNYTKLNDVILMPDYTTNPFVDGITDHASLPNYTGSDKYA